MKRIITFMMALALVLSLSVTAFAAGGETAGSITITNATKDQGYAVYKIFNATYEAEGTSVTYTIDSENQFFTKMFGADGKAENTYFNYHESTGVVTIKENVDNSQLFKYLDELVEGTDPTAAKTADGTALTFDDIPTGYYVIKRTSGDANAVTIHTAKPDAEVIDKNQLPGGDIDKTTDKETANVGDTIHWEVKFTATNYDGEEKVLSYTIKDTLTPEGWAAIDLSTIVITVGGVELEDGAWNLNQETSSPNGFELEIPWVNEDEDQTFKYAATAEVVVTYSATVLEAAATTNPTEEELKNTATVEWGSDTIHQDETETEVYNMGFTKVDGTDATKTLPGAIFALYSDEACTQPINVKANGPEGVYILDTPAEEGKTNTVTTPANGQVVIMGLDEGTYYLKETKAPEGYNMLTEAVPVTVSKDAADELTFGEGESAVTYQLNNAELNIANNSGVELPSTGGMGTMMMISFGTMVAIAFAVLMITQKKMSVYRD